MNVLANAYGALLAVHKLKAISSHSPIHCIEREILAHGVDHFVALLIVVDELALECWTNVEAAFIANHATLPVVLVAVNEVAD